MQKTTITLATRRQGTEFIDPHEVVEVLDSLVLLFTTIDSNTCGAGSPRLDWGITNARTASPLSITLEAEPKKHLGLDAEPEVVETVIAGLRELSTNAAMPHGFNDEAIKCARRLSKVLSGGIKRITIDYADGRSFEPDSRIATNVNKILRKSRPIISGEYGSLEGIIRQITVDDREGQEKSDLVIVDRVSGDAVRCYFQPEDAEKFGAKMRHRIVVYGVMARDESGKINSIQVDHHEAIGDQENLPTLRDL